MAGRTRVGSSGAHGILVNRLNTDSPLYNELQLLGLFPHLGVYVDRERARVEINCGVGRNMLDLPSREYFDAIDKIAGNVKSVLGNKP